MKRSIIIAVITLSLAAGIASPALAYSFPEPPTSFCPSFDCQKVNWEAQLYPQDIKLYVGPKASFKGHDRLGRCFDTASAGYICFEKLGK